MKLEDHLSRDWLQFLTFWVNQEIYAVNINSVKEILNYFTVTPMPLTTPYLRGVINLRGVVIPLFDLGYRLTSQVSNVNRKSCIVIVEIGADHGVQQVGFLVDCVSAVLNLRPQEIIHTPEFGMNLRTDFVLGMTKIEEEFIPILDEQQLFSQSELIELIPQG